MRRFVAGVLVLLLSLPLSAQRYTTVRKLPLFQEPDLHTFVIHFPTEYDAYNNLPERSPWYLPMLSRWKYTFVTDDSGIAQSATTRYADTTWKPLIDRVVVDNQAGKQGTLLMRKVVPVPENWYGLQVFIHFDYLTVPVTIWVNGIRIGVSRTAKWGCEWNITPYLVFGRLNAILLQCDVDQASSVELGNTWLYAFPNVAIWDFSVNWGKNSKNKPVVEASVLAKAFLPGIDDKFTVEFQLYNRRGQQILIDRRKGVKPVEEKWITFKQVVPECHAWEADSPYWYTALFLLKNKDNETVDAIKYRLGMRTITVNDSALQVNMRMWPLDSLQQTNIYRIRPTFLINYPYRWLIYDLTPHSMGGDDLIKAIEKQVLTYRNYAPVAAWQVSLDLPVEQRRKIEELIRRLDASRPILWHHPSE